MKAPPGPVAFPLVGSLPAVGLGQITHRLGPPLHRQLAQLAEVHGGVMSVQMGREPWVVLSQPELVHEAFVLKGSDFSGRPMVPSMSISSGSGRAGFARRAPDQRLLALRRVAFSQLFGEDRVEAARSQFVEEAALLAEHLLADADGAVPMRTSIRRCVANMVLRYAFSTRVPHITERGAALQSAAHAELLALTDAIWSELTDPMTFVIDLLGVPADSQARAGLRRLVRKRDTVLKKLIAERRSRPRRPALEQDMLDVLLSSGLPEADIYYTLVDLFVAGVNTVSSAIEWTLLLAAEHPLEQERARAGARVSSSAGSSQCVRALTNEALRTKPPLLLPRLAVRDSSIGGYHVPAGRVVYANSWALTHAKSHWREPAAFRPERWLREEADLGRGSGGGASACKFLPFSVGQRSCPGARLAEAELHAVTHTLLTHVRWARTAPLDLREEFGLTLLPAVPQRLRFSPVSTVGSREGGRKLAAAATASSGSRMRVRMPARMVLYEKPLEQARAVEGGYARGSSRAYVDGAGGAARRRATRRQRLEPEEASTAVEERFCEAAEDRRGSWRASKAKSKRRNRRYQNRLLQGFTDTIDTLYEAE